MLYKKKAELSKICAHFVESNTKEESERMAATYLIKG